MKYSVSLEEAIVKLQVENKNPFTVVMEHGSMSVEYFAPKIRDTQSPHQQDELYIIVSGESWFNRKGERIYCTKGDVLFVPAGMDHRFEDFTENFATWVIFYGPRGGEK